MSSTTRPDPMRRFEGQQSECDHTVTLRNSDLMAIKKEVHHSWLPAADSARLPAAIIAIMTSSTNSTESTACNPRGVRATWRRSRPVLAT